MSQFSSKKNKKKIARCLNWETWVQFFLEHWIVRLALNNQPSLYLAAERFDKCFTLSLAIGNKESIGLKVAINNFR